MVFVVCLIFVVVGSVVLWDGVHRFVVCLVFFCFFTVIVVLCSLRTCVVVFLCSVWFSCGVVDVWLVQGL